ncbi:MAG: flippase [Candidatus Woesearchaeota archaeon]
MTEISKIIKNTGILFTGNILLKALTFFLTIIISRNLGVASFGEFSFIVSFTALFSVVSDLGIKVMSKRELSVEKQDNTNLVFNSILAKAFLSVSMIVAIVIFSFVLGFKGELNLLLLMSLCVILMSFSDYFNFVFQAFDNMSYGIIAQAERVILRLVLTFLFLSIGLGLWGILVAYLIACLVELATLIILYHIRVKRLTLNFDLRSTKRIIIASLPLGGTLFFTMLYFKIDMTMLFYFRGEIESGIYGAAYNLLDMLQFIPLSLTAALAPCATRYFVCSRRKLARLYHDASKYMILISVPTAFGFLALGDKIISLLYGNEFTSATPVARLLIFAAIPLFLNYVSTSILVASHHEKFNLYSMIVAFVINIVGNLILIPLYGIYGATFSTLLCEILLLIGNTWYITSKLFKINLASYFWIPILLSFATSIVLRLLSWLNTFLLILIGVVTYSLLLYIFGVVKEKDLTIFRSIIK